MENETTLCRAHKTLRTARLLYHLFLQDYISANSTEQEADAQDKMNQCKEVIAELTTLINSHVPPTPMPAPVEAFYHQTSAQNA